MSDPEAIGHFGATVPEPDSRFGVVVIGRNEGDRLRVCLASIVGKTARIVYVDSGSSDGSVGLASSMGVSAVALDMNTPFTAARARNHGFDHLRQRWPAVAFVQFVDGDCEVIDGWLFAASAYLTANPDVACVCGRLRERFPERSVYNRLCDAEWARPAGDASSCGGVAMMRADLFESVGGFRSDITAGEEAELCSRLRANGGQVSRVPTPMALHDAAMYRFGQWWVRSKRTGFGYANTLALRLGDDPVDDFRRVARPWLWFVAWPLLTGIGSVLWGGAALPLLAVYPVLVLRNTLAAEGTWRARFERGFFLMLGKLPELAGQLQFFRNRRSRAASTSFDYKV